MSKVAVVYWSQTGNTEAMANAVAEAAGAELITAADFSADKANEFDAIAFGCPAMGAEVLEEDEFQPMWDAVKANLNGKKIALFGSYGWGDGEWMRNWEEDAKSAGADLVTDSVTANEAPDDDALAACKALGEALAK
ncbi:MAG: flavodoxin [Oscillospiraceae bacterium]|nr:flavodoxin [Oscillospiraceae bacterium]